METGYLKMVSTLFELQVASIVALADAGSRCVRAVAEAQPVVGSSRIGVLTLLAQLDHARGPRPQS